MSLVGAPILVATVIATTAACAAALLAPLVRGRAALRHLLWQGALVVATAGAVAAVVPLHPRIVLPILRASATPATAPIARPSRADAGVSAPSHRKDARIVLVLWFVGCSCILLRYARSLSCASTLRRDASRVDAPRWHAHVAAARAALGYHGPLELLVSREIDVPVVTGLWRPAILLPVAASEWSESDARLVCLHEIAHLERGDHFGRALGTLAVALHWFNPVIWWLNSRAAMDSELAADEAVLSAGVRSTDYAEMLISIAERTLWRPAVIPGVALVRRPLLTTRVHAILAASRQRAGIGRRQRRLAIVTAAVVAATTGTARVQLVAAHEATRPPSVVTLDASRVESGVARTLPTPASRSRAVKNHTARTVSSYSPHTQAPSEPDETWTGRAVAGLTELLDDPSPQVRAAAARSLARLGAGEARR